MVIPHFHFIFFNMKIFGEIIFQDAQSWTALFRAFSSHRQPSASLTKLFPSWAGRQTCRL